jgi:phage terminase small subunit
MQQRGRKSSAALALAPVAELRRIPDAPGHLTEEQSTVWRLTMASAAGDMIGTEAHPVLVEYCRAVVLGDQIAVQLNAFNTSWLAEDEALKRWDKLAAMQARNTSLMAALAGKLRINPSSRIRPENAGVMAKRAGSKPKPWQSE